MSLLLDALKKAAEDKNKKSEEPANTSTADEELNLDLDIRENADFPQVDEQLADRVRSEKTETGDGIFHDRSDRVESTEVFGNREQAPQPEPAIEPKENDENAAPGDRETGQPFSGEDRDRPTVSGHDQPAGEDRAPTLEPAVEENIDYGQSSQDKEALRFLINKSKRQSEKNRFRKRLVFGSMAVLILLVLIVFSLLKLLSVSDQLYTGDRVPEAVPPVSPKAVSTTDMESKIPARPVEPAPAKPVVVQRKSADTEKPVVRRSTAHIGLSPPEKKRPIQIIRKTVVDPTDEQLRRAYLNFNDGRYQAADELYRKVLEREPKNRDALLGIAAVALKLNRPETARRHYRYLLQLNPQDALARAGLSSLDSSIDADLNESRIKLMLREQPRSAHLYFALGSLYAEKNRWAEAQQAFFSAWALDGGNAEFAFNLAVSLDHLGKTRQAIDFYEKSIRLNQSARAGFSNETIRERIEFLKTQNE